MTLSGALSKVIRQYAGVRRVMTIWVGAILLSLVTSCQDYLRKGGIPEAGRSPLDVGIADTKVAGSGGFISHHFPDNRLKPHCRMSALRQ